MSRSVTHSQSDVQGAINPKISIPDSNTGDGSNDKQSKTDHEAGVRKSNSISRHMDTPKLSKDLHGLNRTRSLPPLTQTSKLSSLTSEEEWKSSRKLKNVDVAMSCKDFAITGQNEEGQSFKVLGSPSQDQQPTAVSDTKMEDIQAESIACAKSVGFTDDPAASYQSEVSSKEQGTSAECRKDHEGSDESSEGDRSSIMSIDALFEYLSHPSRRLSRDRHDNIDEAFILENLMIDEGLLQGITHEDFETDLQPLECQICLGRADVMTYCCKFCICTKCRSTYINLKVSEAQVQIECPNTDCHVLLQRALIEMSLTKENKIKYKKFVTDESDDPYRKTCPTCGKAHSIEPSQLQVPKRKLRNGLQVCCPRCNLVWCFLCQAPYHTGVTCKEYRKGDVMLRKWAKEWSYGQFNAQKCPKCKIYIQKADGCDHLICSQCVTSFCYRCGKRYINTKFLGNHWSRYSVFGCKYRLLPDRPALRRLIRGSCFAGLIGGGIVLAGLGLALGAGLIGASVVIVPGYGIFCLRRHLWRKRQHKRFLMRKERERMEKQRRFEELISNKVAREPALRPLWEFDTGEVPEGSLSGIEEEFGPGMDTQQVHVIVHRSVSLNQDESQPKSEGACGVSLSEEREEGGFYINKYTTDGSEMTVLTPGEAGAEQGCGSDSVITVTDFKEIPSTGGYTTLVANIVSRPAGNAAKPDTGRAESAAVKAKGMKQGSESADEKASGEEEAKASENSEKTRRRVLGKAEGGEEEDPSETSEERRCKRSFSCPQNACEVKEGHSGMSKKSTSPNLLEASQDGDSKTEESPAVPLVTSSSSKDPTADGCGYNGCFGNIFSKRSQGQQNSDGSDAKVKQQQVATVGSQKKTVLGWKSSTWEKTRRALGSGGEDKVGTECKDQWEAGGDITISSLAAYIDAADKASLSQLLAGLSQLDRSKVVEDSLLLPELDRDFVKRTRPDIKALEDLFLARSKKFSRKCCPATTGSEEGKDVKLKKEKTAQAVLGVDNSADMGSTAGGCDSADIGVRGGEGAGTCSRRRRRRSMVEMSTSSLSPDTGAALGSGTSCSNVSCDRETLQDTSIPQPGVKCNISSPTKLTTRL